MEDLIGGGKGGWWEETAPEYTILHALFYSKSWKWRRGEVAPGEVELAPKRDYERLKKTAD